MYRIVKSITEWLNQSTCVQNMTWQPVGISKNAGAQMLQLGALQSLCDDDPQSGDYKHAEKRWFKIFSKNGQVVLYLFI